MVADGVLITGISGAEFGVRAFLDGYDPETGKRLWRRYTTIPAPGEKGHDTWRRTIHGSAAAARTLDYRLVRSRARSGLLGTGNAGPWDPRGRPGDNLYTASVLAISPKTGEIVWHYQLVPNEMFDLDAVWEWILADIDVDGAKCKVAMHFSRGGFLYVIDRTNGSVITAKPFEEGQLASHVDIKTGRPIETEVSQRVRAGEQIELWPGQWGGKNWAHAAFNPETGLLYANTMHNSRLIKSFRPSIRSGNAISGSKTGRRRDRRADRACRRHQPAHRPARLARADRRHPALFAVLATAGGLLFTGKETGE